MQVAAYYEGVDLSNPASFPAASAATAGGGDGDSGGGGGGGGGGAGSVRTDALTVNVWAAAALAGRLESAERALLPAAAAGGPQEAVLHYTLGVTYRTQARLGRAREPAAHAGRVGTRGTGR